MSMLNLAELGIMIVDDQQAARSMLKKMLKEIQIHQVFEASNGREALRLLDSAPDMISLILCDWNMANVSGIELLRQVRSVRSEVPFLMVTGRADKESVLEAKEAGVSGYISKPYSQAQLEAKIRVALSNRAAA
jgi:two-component system, chemotaxis family, chemotaxis protein CheY